MKKITSGKNQLRTVVLVLFATMGIPGCGGSVMVNANTAAAVTPEQSLIVFTRAPRLMNKEPSRLWDGDQFIGELKGNQKLEYVTTPGKHLFVSTTRSGKSAFLDAELGAGKKYVVKVLVTLAGMSKAGVVLDPVIPGEKADVGPNEVNQLVGNCIPMAKDPAQADAYAAKLRPDFDAAMAEYTAGTAKSLTLAEKDSW